MLAVGALAVLGLGLLGARLRVSYRTPLTGCARDDGTGGASGLARWADRIGVPHTLLEVPIWEASTALSAPEGNCVLTMGDGPWAPLHKGAKFNDHWPALRAWLERGNALIVVTTEPIGLPPAFQHEVLPGMPGAGPPPVPSDDANGPEGPEDAKDQGPSNVENRPATAPAAVRDGGGTLRLAARGPRWKLETPSASGKGKARANAGRSPERVAGDERGGALFRTPVGKGAVYVLLDDFAWTNSGFDQADNARVLADVLKREARDGGALAFDEYRHGHGRAESFLSYLLDLPGSSAFLGLAMIWALLYLHGRNVRLGPVEEQLEQERRTAREQIDAVAGLYGRARAAPLVVEAVARRVRQIARTSAETPPALAEVLDRADVYRNREERPAKPAEATRLVAELIQIRKELYGSRTIS